MIYAFNSHNGTLLIEDSGEMEGLVETLRRELDNRAPKILREYGAEAKHGDLKLLKFTPPTEVAVMGEKDEKQAILRGGKTIFYADLSPHPVLTILNHYFACKISTKSHEDKKSTIAKVEKTSLIPSSVSVAVGWWKIDIHRIVDDNARVSLSYLAQEILRLMGLVCITYPPTGRWGKWATGLVEKVVNVVLWGKRGGKLVVDGWVMRNPAEKIVLTGAVGGMPSFSTPILTIFPSNPPLYVFFDLIFDVVPGKKSKHPYLFPEAILISFRFTLKEEINNTLLATSKWRHKQVDAVSDSAVLSAITEDDIIGSINSLLPPM